MTKKVLVQKNAEETGLTRLLVTEIVQNIFDSIVNTLVAEGRVELRNFGVFEVRRRGPRKGRNPRTGEEADVPANSRLLSSLARSCSSGSRRRRVDGEPAHSPANVAKIELQFDVSRTTGFHTEQALAGLLETQRAGRRARASGVGSMTVHAVDWLLTGVYPRRIVAVGHPGEGE